MRPNINELHEGHVAFDSKTEMIVQDLKHISAGERIEYHRGENLGECPLRIKKVVRELSNKGKINTFHQRVRDPVYEGSIDHIRGVGMFVFLAVGK